MTSIFVMHGGGEFEMHAELHSVFFPKTLFDFAPLGETLTFALYYVRF